MEAEQSPAASLLRLVMETQPLHQRFGLADQLLEGGVGALRRGVLHHLDLIELVAADHAALFRAVGARLPAVARAYRRMYFLGSSSIGEDLVAVQVHQRGLRGRQHELMPSALVGFAIQ